MLCAIIVFDYFFRGKKFYMAALNHKDREKVFKKLIMNVHEADLIFIFKKKKVFGSTEYIDMYSTYIHNI